MVAKKWPLLLSLLVCLPLSAQKYTGAIRGTVTDPSGATVSGAEVIVKNVGTAATRTTTTGDEGFYAFIDLQPAVYEVRVKHPKFRESVITTVEVNVSSETVINAQLQIGAVTEQVTVEANAVQVETNTGTVGNVVEGNQVRELPMNGRSFAQLTQLQPGVSAQNNFSSKNKGLMAGVDFSVNGNQTTSNLFLVDGVNDNDIGSNRTILIYPSLDAIQEFKMLRNSYGPEYGQASGAVINIVTRSGSNDWHGGAFYFGRNDALNATDYFNKLNGVPKDVLRRNDWGYNVGGPIKKDKLFFFFSEEWNRELRGKARSANVPTVAEKSGDFSNLRRDQNGNLCEAVPTLPGSAAPAPTIVPGTLDAAGSMVLKLLPDPNLTTVPSSCNNWSVSLTSPIYWRQENARVDYKLGSTWTLMGRYTHDAWSQPYPSTLGFWGDDVYPSVESSWIQPGAQATIKLSKLFGSTAVNDFQVSYSMNRINAELAGNNPALDAQIAAAIPNEFSDSVKTAGANVAMPLFNGGLGNGASTTIQTQAPWHNNEQLIVLKDDFSKVHGKHTFKMGMLASNNQKNELLGSSYAEAVNFSGVKAPTNDPNAGTLNSSGTTGNGTYDALWAGRTWDASEQERNPFSQQRWHDFEFYFGDTWKFRRNLTIELGGRYSALRNPYSANDAISSFSPSAYDPVLGADPCNGVIIVPGTDFCHSAGFAGGTDGSGRALKKNNKLAIAPRVGVAWDPTGSGKMSIRAGAGQFYQRERLNNTLTMAGNAPFSLTVGGGGTLLRTLDTRGALSSDITGSPNFGENLNDNLPYTWQYNLTVERELFRDTKVELGYVGNRGYNALQYLDINGVPAANRPIYSVAPANSLRPFNSFGRINFAQWSGKSNYNSLQALLRSRFKSLDAQFSYTYSKSLSDTDLSNSGGAGQTTLLLDPSDPHLNYGPSFIDRPHIFVGNVVYNFPPLAGKGLTRYVLGGWEAATIVSYESGTPINVYATGGVTNANGGLSGSGYSDQNDRPNVVAGQPCRASGSGIQWLNPNRWTLNGYQLGTFGDSPVGDCYGPGIANTDFSLYKNFKVRERYNVQFRVELFNAFNKTQFIGNSQSGTGINVNLNNGNAFACTAANPCSGVANNTVVYNPATDLATGFGQVTSDRGPREIQYALKITF
jgi:hypothetical protein